MLGSAIHTPSVNAPPPGQCSESKASRVTFVYEAGPYGYLKATDRYAKTIVFWEDIKHTGRIRQALANANTPVEIIAIARSIQSDDPVVDIAGTFGIRRLSASAKGRIISVLRAETLH